MKLQLRYHYPGSNSEKAEICFDVVGTAQDCITFVYEKSNKPALALIESVVAIVNAEPAPAAQEE